MVDLLGKSRKDLETARKRARANGETFTVEKHERVSGRLPSHWSKTVAWEKMEKAAESLATAIHELGSDTVDRKRLERLREFLENAAFDKKVTR